MIESCKKGYLLEVKSWENDGDNYKTNYMIVESKEEAASIVHMCKNLFTSVNSNTTGIGNTEEDYQKEEVKKRILKYFTINKNVLPKQNMLTNEEIIDACMTYNRTLLGYTEDYYSRVFESVKVYYIPKQVKIEEIQL